MKRDAESHAEADTQRRELVETKNKAEMLLHSTKKSLEEHGDKISQEARGNIESAISNLEDTLKGDDKDAIEAALNQLGSSAEELGKAVYEATAADAQQNAGDAGASDGESQANADDVIDAEYEVKDD